jgi:hypothetical protein
VQVGDACGMVVKGKREDGATSDGKGQSRCCLGCFVGLQSKSIVSAM